MKDKFKHLWVPEGGPVWGRKQHPIGTLEGITKERERERDIKEGGEDVQGSHYLWLGRQCEEH